ncbi:hypothetical protein EDM76_09480 [bacterium]|nr:MAG: hypothetical protein EDM76_09480 [bacterium]
MVRRDEAFEIDFYERVLKRTPTQIDALRQLGHLYTRTGRVREGLTVDLKLALLCPRDAVAQYNLACSYALLRDTERAIACLAEAVRLGYRDAAHLREPGTAAAQNEFARAHYEQHMRVTGTLQIENGPELPISGHGLRDHSWGPRYWQSTPSYRWITGNFGDDLGMVVSVVGDRKGGVFHKGQELLRITDIDLDTEYEGNTNYHSGLKATVTLENGDVHKIEGRVTGFIPLRNRRAGQFTHIGEGMTEYTLDGARKGYGLSEYLDQVE